MDPRFLSQFATIVKFGSISRAAERLNTTQPTLSRTVQIIENRVGAPLLIRGRHGVRPTEIGTRLAESGQRIIDQAEHSEEILRQWRYGLDSEVRVGVGPLLALHAMHGFVQETLSHTRYVTHFTTATASTLIKQLNDGSQDMVLAPARLDMPQETLVRTVVFNDQVSIFAGIKSKFYGTSRALTLDELKQETWVKSGAATGIFEPRTQGDLQSSPTRMVFTSGINMELALLKSSDVLLSLPRRLTMMSGDLPKGHLLTIQDEMPHRDIALWVSRKNLERPDVVDLSERLIRYFSLLDQKTP